MSDTANRLAQELEGLSEAALAKLRVLLDMDVDVENGHLLRAQTTAAAITLNTQLRADALRLRAARSDKALERLIELIEAKQATIPCVAAPAG